MEPWILQSDFSTCVCHLKWNAFPESHLPNNTSKMLAVISRRFWISFEKRRVYRSWIMSTSDVCGVITKMFFLGKPMKWQAMVLRFQRHNWISLYGLSFNLAALERLAATLYDTFIHQRVFSMAKPHRGLFISRISVAIDPGSFLGSPAREYPVARISPSPVHPISRFR